MKEKMMVRIHEDWDFVLKQETEWELGMIYQAQKAMDYIIEEDN